MNDDDCTVKIWVGVRNYKDELQSFCEKIPAEYFSIESVFFDGMMKKDVIEARQKNSEEYGFLLETIIHDESDESEIGIGRVIYECNFDMACAESIDLLKIKERADEVLMNMKRMFAKLEINTQIGFWISNISLSVA